MIKDLVSIMIPCYNGEKFLQQLFAVFSNQTYKKIEILFVNDGSVDDTEKRILEYGRLWEHQGITFRYFHQSHRGAAAAINTALPHIAGEYCMWFDADDSMTKDHIQKKVEYLQNHPKCDVVMCEGIRIDVNGRVIGKLGGAKRCREFV